MLLDGVVMSLPIAKLWLEGLRDAQAKGAESQFKSRLTGLISVRISIRIRELAGTSFTDQSSSLLTGGAGMPYYGYVRNSTSSQPLDLREVTIDLSTSDLRRLAAFLIDCADKVDSRAWRSDHRHIGEFDASWDADATKPDTIVLHPSPDPPQYVISND